MIGKKGVETAFGRTFSDIIFIERVLGFPTMASIHLPIMAALGFIVINIIPQRNKRFFIEAFAGGGYSYDNPEDGDVKLMFYDDENPESGELLVVMILDLNSISI